MYTHVNIHIHISSVVIIIKTFNYKGCIFCYYLPPIFLKLQPWDFPGGPVIKALSLQFMRCGVSYLWLGN